MIVCHCHAVTDRTIRQAVRAGARTVKQVGQRCGAGTGCGGCKLSVAAVVAEERLLAPVRSEPTEAPAVLDPAASAA